MSRPAFKTTVEGPALSDTDLMPFGKFKGVPMQDVSARYLFWLWCDPNGPQLENDHTSPVAGYIRKNLSALASEHKDGIWHGTNAGRKQQETLL